MNKKSNERYQRQILLKEFGDLAQEKLTNAKILVIGAGGLGCPALQYLAAAGVGKIGIVDFDTIDISNLHRQILFTTQDIGKLKSETAATRLRAMNPEIEIVTYHVRFQQSNAFKMMADYDLVIDGSDNFLTRYLINDACFILNKPLVYGAVLRFEGQVGVFNLEDKSTGKKVNYRDLFPEPPKNGETFSCAEAGVIGVLPGIIGTMQATEAIKIITGVGKPLINSVLSYSALNNVFYEFKLNSSETSLGNMPKNEEEFLNFDYNWFCLSNSTKNQISILDFNGLLKIKNFSIIDVREPEESLTVEEFEFINIPLDALNQKEHSLFSENKIVFFCNSGSRSLKAVEWFKKKYPEKEGYSLTGGILAWKRERQFNSHARKEV